METFGRFTLLKRLGAGGMGEVFLARAPDRPGPVVVKRILPHLTENPRFLRLFLDETRIAARLNHPNIARILELGEAGGTWFVAMEHVPGLDLREVLKRARELNHHVPLSVAVYVAVEVAKGLEAAHRATDAQGRALKIVHRDVSPHNVLVASSGAVKLIDFGVAKAANKAMHTATGILKGKFPYMAPEQAHARPVDARTDVFALGIVLWEMLCGRYLFRGKTDAITLRLVREAEVPLPTSLRDDVPPELERVVMKALRKDAADRYPSAAAFQEALEGVAANLPPPDLRAWLAEYEDSDLLEALSEDGEEEPESSPATELEPEDATTIAEAMSVAANPVRPRPTRSDRPTTTSDEVSLAQARKLLEQVSGRPTNIGPQATTFVGRVAELADLHQHFRQGVRLVTLLGPGGTGKTRLSLQFASQLVSYFQAVGEKGRRRGGVWFCDLTEATDKDGVCAAVARALGVPLVPGDAVKQLGHAILARGETLLVLDNFEQVIAAAPETVEPWLRAAPRARFVVSSRELLRVADETVFEVPPLRTPKDAYELRGAEAVELFIERARAVRPGWEPSEAELSAIGELVRQLDGMPLAIELAAGRMGVLSPSQLVQRLPRRFELLVNKGSAVERQATLRGAIDWSWNNLSPAEAAVLAQLSVFRGGFSAEAVEAVVRLPAGATPDSPLDALLALRAKSLVRAYFPSGDEGETRFGLFETIREYAREKAVALGLGAEAAARHAGFYLGLGLRLAANAEGSKAQLDALDLERDNLSAVFHRAIDAGDGERAVRAVLALDPLLLLRGPFQLHQQLLGKAVSLNPEPTALRAAGLEALGRVQQARGQLAEAEASSREVLALAQALGDVGLEGRAELYLGVVERVKGHRAEALRRFERALRLQRQVGDRRMEGRAQANLAALHDLLGNSEEALELYNDAIAILREVHDRRYEGVTLSNLGVQQQSLGLLKQARANYLAALAIHRDLGNRRSEGIANINLGDLNADLEQPGQARSHYESALVILREAGARRVEGVALVSLASLHLQYGEYEEAAQRYREGIGVLQEAGDLRYEGLGRAGLAAVEALQGQLEAAEEGMAEATRVLTEVGDGGFLDALDLYRGHLELGHALRTGSEHQASVLLDRVRRRLEHAQRAGPPDETHPAGTPSPADRSEQVRAALRSLRGALVDHGKEP